MKEYKFYYRIIHSPGQYDPGAQLGILRGPRQSPSNYNNNLPCLANLLFILLVTEQLVVTMLR